MPEADDRPPLTIDGQEYRRCPAGVVDRRLANEAFGLWRHYRAGFLPSAGGVYDQSERDMELIEIVAAVADELDAEAAEKAAARGKA